jgi:hypothetical protein
MANDKIFADGFIVKRKETAPEFVIASVSVKVDDFGKFVKEHEDKGWINMDIKKSQSGKLYAELNTWKPDQKVEKVAQGKDDLPW